MLVINRPYRTPFLGCLAIAFMFVVEIAMATGDQTLINKPIQTIRTNIGDAAQAIAYNSTKNEYFVVYTDFDGSCPTNQELRGQVIDAVTGGKSGSEVTLTTSGQPCSTHIINNPKVVFNELENEYLVVFKSSAALGAQIKFLTINANNLQVSANSIILDEDEIADPFKNLTVELDFSSNIYAIGYHSENALSESSLLIKFVDGSSKSILGYSNVLDKNNFVAGNKGVFGSQLIFNNDIILVAFEVKFTLGSQVHGVFINPQTGVLVGNIFQISPDGTGITNYMNPAIALNSASNEMLVVYEEARVIGSNYALNYKIQGQRINSSTGDLISPINSSLTELPATPFTEESKLPSVCYSGISQEYLISFYGIRYAAGSDLYNIYLQRVNAGDLSAINSLSAQVIPMAGTQVVESNFLKSLPISFNSTYNQFLFGWNMESNNDVQTQLWRYDNNPPTNLSISNAAQNENQPLGSTFATFSAIDPDPEDSSPTYTLASGTGSDDNSYFTIQGNELKIAKNLNYEEANSRNIRVRATDSQGLFTENSFALGINDINETPFNLSLTQPLSVEENLAPSSFTTTISVEDDDLGETHTFTLVNGDSSNNNSNFEIEVGSNTLNLIKPLNFEDTSRQYLRIKSADNQGLFVEKAFVIDVIDVNEIPEKLTVTPNTLPENDPDTIAIVDVIDPDLYSNYAFSLSAGDGDDDNEKFSLIDNELRPTAAFNYEQKDSYNIRLKATDGKFTKVEAFIISVFNVNDTPDSISLENKTIIEGHDNGAIIGEIYTFDQDIDDTHTLELVEGNSYFFINSSTNTLHVLASLEFNDTGTNVYPITIKSSDNAGASISRSFNISVIKLKDTEPPEILDLNLLPSMFNSDEDTLVFSVKATDNEQLANFEFFHRPIRSRTEFKTLTAQIKFNSNKDFMEAEIKIDVSMTDEMGLEYYIKVTDAANTFFTTDTLFIYKSYKEKNFAAVNRMEFDGSFESYKIITNPYRNEIKTVSLLAQNYEASTDDSWRLFSYENNQLTEIGIDLNKTLKPGKGYWFNKVENLNETIEFDNAKVPQNNRNNLYVMQLEKGWNMIGNPYPFDIKWSDILQYNGYAENDFILYEFDKRYSESNYLKEFEGGYVFANERTVLEIPLNSSQIPNGRIAKENMSIDNWLVNFTLENGKLKNELGGIGMHESAVASYDKFDRPLLPRFINYLDMYFSHPEHFSLAFSRDIVELKDNHIWEFEASTNHENKNVTLSWNAGNLKKSTKQLMLYDVLRDKTIDMIHELKYSFSLDHSSRFKAIYGDEAFVKDALGKIKIEALSPYPNPFNDIVTIPINLPYSTNEYNIEYSIYNLMGEKVFENKLESITPGLYRLNWNEDQSGNIKQGIYIYSIKVKNGFLTNNFHGRIVKD